MPITSKKGWGGRILSGLAAVFLLFDGVGKLVRIQPAIEGTVRLGYAESIVAPLGILLVACTIGYIVPRAAVAGAILLTGYLGGAVASQVRSGDGWFPVFFPVIVGVLLWAGLWLREPRLTRLIPFVAGLSADR
ncbi:MAG: DoxX family protein [Rudaea sp.]